MKRRAGVWIDRGHAILVEISSSGHEISRFTAGTTEPFPATIESRAQHAYTPNDFQPEDRIERKEQASRKHMYDSVLHAIQGIESLLILGPGEAKKEFAKHIESKRIQKLVVEVETSDKMTEPQLAAKVLHHFADSQLA